MTFQSAVGHGNLPNGLWSPVIYSQKTLDYLTRVAISSEITNTDYEGEISNYGDTVNIIKQPVITISDYARGTKIVPQDLNDEQIQMVVDQGKYYAFQMDDIEKRLSHIDWEQKAMASGAYELKNNYDTNILSYIQTNSTTAAATGTAGSPITIGYGASNSFTPLDYIGRFARLMDENDVPETERYFVATPAFWEQLGREDGKFIDAAVVGGGDSALRNRKLVTSKMIHGFICLKSNNVPVDSSSNISVLAVHKSATATATALVKAETQRLIESFGDQYKSLLVFGRKMLRPECSFTGSISSLADA